MNSTPDNPNDKPKETVYDKMVRLGLLGCVDDAPPDLRTNPAYMEGFGSSDANPWTPFDVQV
jgi:hypothetical protein